MFYLCWELGLLELDEIYDGVLEDDRVGIDFPDVLSFGEIEADLQRYEADDCEDKDE